MKVIRTNFISQIELGELCVYDTTFEDAHFLQIIERNIEEFGEGFILPNKLFVYMDNEHIDDTNNFYASISFYIHQRLDNVIYEICSITIEEQFDNENLETFIRKVIEWLPIIEDNVRVALSNSPLDTTYALSTENHITECINQIMQRVR